MSNRTARETKEHRKPTERDKNGPRLPGYSRKSKGEIWAAVACFSAKQGLGIVWSESGSIAMQCMLCREGEKESKVERESPASNRPRGVVCEGSLVFRLKPANECNIEAQGQKERLDSAARVEVRWQGNKEQLE